MKTVLVSYECVSGEHSTGRHTLVNVPDHRNRDACIHDHFMGLFGYEAVESYVEGESYYYGELAVNITGQKELTETETRLLRELL